MADTPLQRPCAGGKKEGQNEKDRPHEERENPAAARGWAGRKAMRGAGRAAAAETGEPRPNTSRGRGAAAMNNGTSQNTNRPDTTNNKKI